MTFRRYALFSVSLLLSAFSFANWTPLAVGNASHRSMTTHNGALFLATYNTGIQKSTNGGASWTLANTGLPVSGAQVKVQSVGHNATTLFCGTESGIYRSTDNGASWVLAQSGIPATSSATIYVNKIYTFNGVTFVVFSGTVAQSSGGVFRTVDNGTSWLQAFNGLQTNMTIYNMAEAGGTLYASTSTSLMKSTDLGQSWTQVADVNYAVYAVEATPARLVALTTFGAKYSTNGGTSWTNSTNYPVATPVAGSELISYDSKFYAITRSGSTGCYRSLDGGVTWEAFNTGLSPQNTFAQEEFHASGSDLFIVCALDVYSTAGSTVGIATLNDVSIPAPFPTTFEDGFNVDLRAQRPGSTIIVMDAAGRELARHPNLPASLVRIDRNGLAAGMYHCYLLETGSGSMMRLGSVIAR
ncbi:MAG: hypothetical protein JNM62_08380 [Flavobacteriales bacterium]|nr:hypothetical protein [Flavobacteriales bacterium]